MAAEDIIKLIPLSNALGCHFVNAHWVAAENMYMKTYTGLLF